MSKKTNVVSYSLTYKIGKRWLLSSIASASLVLALSGTIAYADTSTTPATESITADSQASTSISDEPLGQSSTQSTPPAIGDSKKQNELPQTAPNTPDTPKPVESSESANTDHLDNLSTPNPSTDRPAKPESTTPSPSQPDTIPMSSHKETRPTSPTSPSQPSPQKPTVTSPVIPLAAPVKNVSIDTWMPNKTLQNMVANALHIDVSQITTDNIKNLKELATAHRVGNTVFVDGQHEFSLKGLELAINLTSLDLSYGETEYTDLGASPTGSGAFGDVIDLSPLSKLTKLTSLNVSGNRIVDLTPLKNLTNLKNLDVTKNRIGNFSMLDAHQITSLKIGKQLVILDYTQRKYVSPNTHSTTVDTTPFLKLPQNYKSDLTKPGLVSPSDFAIIEKIIQEFHTADNSGKGTSLIYVSGMTPDDYTLSNGILNFINIKPQKVVYTSSDYPGTVALPVPGNHHYYLRADLKDSEGVKITLLIPYSNATVAAPVTVHYLDENKVTIKPDLTFGNDKIAGDTYALTSDQLTIDGYTYDDTRNLNVAITGTLSDEAQTITLFYRKNTTKPVTPSVTPPTTPASTVTVTVHYQDGQGNQLLPDAQLTGQTGTNYQVATPILKGYQLDSTANPTGTFSASDQTIMVTYHLITSDDGGVTITPSPDTNQQPDMATLNKPQAASTQPSQPSSTATHGQAASISSSRRPKPLKAHTTTTTRSKQPIITTTKSTLPQTNEQHVSPLVGLALLLGSLVGLYRYRKRN